MAETRQFDLRCRVVQDEVLPRHPLEPHAQRHEPRVLRAEGERLAVFLAVVEQIPLIAFEHWARDLCWLGESAFGAPLQEEPDMYLAIFDRVYGVVPHPERVQMLVHERREWRC